MTTVFFGKQNTRAIFRSKQSRKILTQAKKKIFSGAFFFVNLITNLYRIRDYCDKKKCLKFHSYRLITETIVYIIMYKVA